VIVHNREADDDLLAELRAWREADDTSLRGRAGVLHAFSGPVSLVREAAALGFYMGVGGPITYRTSAKTREVIAEASLGRLLLETDAPFLSPVPHRGRRNEPAYVSLVGAKMAELRGATIAEIARTTSQNAAGLFAWDDGNDSRNLH
jgi:TatD DNase family protein